MNLPLDYRKLLFPTGVTGSDGVTIEGLPKGSVPQNCNVVYDGHEPNSRGDRRQYYVVLMADKTLVFFRVCTAGEGSGYDEFVVFHEFVPYTNLWNAFKASLRLRDRMRFCENITSHY